MPDEVYKALADPTRRVILDELQERDGQSLFEICSRLAMKHGLSSTRQAISQHLDVLEAAGLVVVRREGRYKLHHLDTSPLAEITRRWPVRDVGGTGGSTPSDTHTPGGTDR
ncbi:ArsR/SmtB family transcription factor [Cellulomonas septica]|uniref:Helix-turn-helix transcriptional regulator n=1 Tax=Cellulomonas septica TaxID=285080 RepID=A0ABX1K3W4_9CELL|nr:metalloregulator ArsR/SmtB family transcription factor [Cellulomonas septica]NKY41261.1 helix-turn-helix transcriptional regulator [Cellulomonas septica]